MDVTTKWMKKLGVLSSNLNISLGSFTVRLT